MRNEDRASRVDRGIERQLFAENTSIVTRHERDSYDVLPRMPENSVIR